jgi:predicted phage terminase large subunit-like protein
MDTNGNSSDKNVVINELAREDFYFFCRYMFRKQYGYKWQQAPHHEIICHQLMRVFRGECTRLILNLPPRYSKTQLMIYFIAWSLGRHPDSEFILTSYSARLCGNNSWQVRNIIGMDAYKAIFPKVTLQHDSKAKDEWRTTASGLVYAAGSGGAITGRGAGKIRDGFGGAIIVDDPLKPNEAHSELIRNGVNEWYLGTLASRTNNPGKTPIIVIMQRLNENDLSGFLLSGGSGEQWENIIMPAIKEDGTALWPEKHSIDKLREMEQANPYNFASQYQQRPSPRTGGLFRSDQLQWIEELPSEPITWWRGWDLASTTTGDWTAGVKLGRTQSGRFIVADVTRVRAGPDERDAAIRNAAAMDGNKVKISIPQDPGQAGKTQALYMTRDLAGFSVTTSPESGDKITRAEPVAAQINVGNVSILRGPWNRDFINELIMFPNGANDDQVDALSRAFSHLITPNRVVISNETLMRFRQRGSTLR